MEEDDKRKLLTAEFTQADTYSRISASGKTLTYIKVAAVIDRLNDSYGTAGWSFDVLKFQVLDADIVVLGRLTIGGATITQVGNAQTHHDGHKEELSIGDAIKSASSDCLVRCVSLLGIGNYLRHNQNLINPRREHPERSSRTQSSSIEPLSEKQLSYLQRLCKGQGISMEALDNHCRYVYSVPARAISKQEGSAIIDNLKNKSFVLQQEAA